MRAAIAALRITAFLAASLFTIAFQSTLMLFTKGPLALVYPRIFHKLTCWIFGVKVVVEGTPVQNEPVVYVGNHLSYIDIQVVGSIVKGSFIAKKEIKSWPLFGILGSMGRTIYISRSPVDAAKEAQVILNRVNDGLPIIIFPEGTSSNGTSVYPFKSSFFELFLNKNLKIQPFTMLVQSINGEPVSHVNRDQYAWHGDMDFGPHFLRLSKNKKIVVKVHFHEPLLSHSYQNRKQLCADTYALVASGLDLSPAPAYGHSLSANNEERHAIQSR